MLCNVSSLGNGVAADLWSGISRRHLCRMKIGEFYFAGAGRLAMKRTDTVGRRAHDGEVTVERDREGHGHLAGRRILGG